MRKRVVSLPIVNSRVIAVTALAMLQAVVALAADDCVTKPNLGATQGGHWYYHVDTVKSRKCWFLRQEDVKGPPAPSAEVQSPTDTVPQSTSPSWLPSLASAFAPTSESGQGLAPTENRIIGNPPDALRRSTLPKEPPQIALHKSQRKQPPKPHERSSTRSSEKQALERDTAPDQASRDALFREFVLWNERQSTVDATLDQTDRDALFREFLLWQERQRSVEP